MQLVSSVCVAVVKSVSSIKCMEKLTEVLSYCAYAAQRAEEAWLRYARMPRFLDRQAISLLSCNRRQGYTEAGHRGSATGHDVFSLISTWVLDFKLGPSWCINDVIWPYSTYFRTHRSDSLPGIFKDNLWYRGCWTMSKMAFC